MAYRPRAREEAGKERLCNGARYFHHQRHDSATIAIASAGDHAHRICGTGSRGEAIEHEIRTGHFLGSVLTDAVPKQKSALARLGMPGASLTGYCDSFVIASAALPATTQFADPATTASSSNQRNPKSSMHSGKSGLMTMYPGITAPGM